MKCLLNLFIVCAISRFIDVKGQNEDNRNESEEVSNDERFNQPGKETSEFEENAGDVEFQGENRENTFSIDEILPKYNDDDFESDVDQTTSGDGQKKKSRQRNKKLFEETLKRFLMEVEAGASADLIGTNQHIKQSEFYTDLGRRFVPQYKYTGAFKNEPGDPSEENELVPEKAPPELVLVVAKESALLGTKSVDPENDKVDRKQISRTGEFWNGVWKEEIDMKNSLRDGQKNGKQGDQKKVLAFQSDPPSAPPEESELVPEKAPSELVLQVAKESAVLGPDNSADQDNLIVDRKKILRTGDFWNGVWKEEVDTKTALRNSQQKKVLSSIKARIKPGSDFYKVVKRLKNVSPRLLYIINKKKI